MVTFPHLTHNVPWRLQGNQKTSIPTRGRKSVDMKVKVIGWTTAVPPAAMFDYDYVQTVPRIYFTFSFVSVDFIYVFGPCYNAC
jgi:hypothetical protein